MQENCSKRFFDNFHRFGHFGQKLVKIGHLAGDVCNGLFKGWKSLKNLKVGVFETDLKQVPFVFRQATCTFSESWGPIEHFVPPHFCLMNAEFLISFDEWMVVI